MPHNGGRTQIQHNALAIDGCYAFMNRYKDLATWVLTDNTRSPRPSQLSANGYPIEAGVAVYNVLRLPRQEDRPGNWIIGWDGGGTVYRGSSVGNGNVHVSGSTTNLVTGVWNGQRGRIEYSMSGISLGTSNTQNYGISTVDPANPITNMWMVHEEDETAFLNGEIWTTEFLNRIADLKPGVWRDVNWSLANANMMHHWSHRKPVGYAYYNGGEIRPEFYGGVTTNSGADYTVAAPPTWNATGATPVHGDIVGVFWSADLPANNPRLKVGSTDFFPVRDQYAFVLRTDSIRRPRNNTLCYLMFDEDLRCWMKWGGDFEGFNSGIPNGVPPELMIDLCKRTGQHYWAIQPYMSADPLGDYMVELNTLAKNDPDFGGDGLRIHNEPVGNEIWNGFNGFAGTRYVQQKAAKRWGSASTVTVANPGVFTLNSHGYSNGTPVYFHIVGNSDVLPAPLVEGKQYNVTSTSLTTNTFTVSDPNIGSSAIEITGAPTGTFKVHITFDEHNQYGRAAALTGAELSTLYGGVDPSKYWFIIGCQAFGSTSGSAPRADSTRHVADGGTAAKTYATHVAVANYYTATTDDNDELAMAFEYSTATTARKLELVEEYVLSALEAGTFGIPNVGGTIIPSWKTGFADPRSLAMTFYEGGFSPDYVSGNNSASITAISKAADGVVTMSGSIYPPIGSTVSFSGVSGMTEINSQTAIVLSRTGQNVTIDLDTSGFTTYTSGGTMTYVNSRTLRNTFRGASRFAPSLQKVERNMLERAAAVGEFPSNYMLSGDQAGSTQVWAMLVPDIYASLHTSALEPRWEAAKRFNQRRRTVSVAT